MVQELEQYIRERVSIEENVLKKILSHFKVVKTDRNEMLCNIGQVCKHFYFIKKGCLRLYEIDDKGNEVTGFSH